MNKELYLFHFPGDWESQIAASATLRSFEQVLINRQDDYQFYVNGVGEGGMFLFEAYDREVVRYETTYNPADRVVFDVEFHFDVIRAQELAKAVKLHITHAFGIMLGVWQCQQLPELVIPVMDRPTKPKILLAYDEVWDGWDTLRDIIETNLNDVDLTILDKYAPKDYTLQNVFDLAVNNQFIICARSPLTYLAASMGRRVLEFYPTANMSQEWLTKSPGSRSYTMLAQEGPEKHRATLVWRLLKESLWLTAR